MSQIIGNTLEQHGLLILQHICGNNESIFFLVLLLLATAGLGLDLCSLHNTGLKYATCLILMIANQEDSEPARHIKIMSANPSHYWTMWADNRFWRALNWECCWSCWKGQIEPKICPQILQSSLHVIIACVSLLPCFWTSFMFVYSWILPFFFLDVFALAELILMVLIHTYA